MAVKDQRNHPLSLLHPDEDLHDINRRGLLLIQKKHGYRYTMDAVLLADFARIAPSATVADFGGGSGVISLLLFERGKGKQHFSIEIMPAYADMASRTARLNQLSHILHSIPLPVELSACVIGHNALDAIVANPPYFAAEQSILPTRTERKTARTMPAFALDAWLKTAYVLLRGKGTFSIVYAADRMLDIMQRMTNAHLPPKRVRLVHPFAHRSANLVLIEGLKDGKPSLKVEPPLVIRDEKGAFTQEMTRIYGFQLTDQQGAPHEK